MTRIWSSIFHISRRFRHHFLFPCRKIRDSRGPKMYSFWHKMFKIVSVYDAAPEPLVVRGYLPSAIAATPLRRLQFFNSHILTCIGAKYWLQILYCKGQLEVTL